MFGNLTGNRFKAKLNVGVIAPYTTLIESLSYSNGNFSVDDIVCVTPRQPADLISNNVTCYGYIIDSTHIGIAFVNSTPNPANVNCDFNICVITATGLLTNATE